MCPGVHGGDTLPIVNTTTSTTSINKVPATVSTWVNTDTDKFIPCNSSSPLVGKNCRCQNFFVTHYSYLDYLLVASGRVYLHVGYPVSQPVSAPFVPLCSSIDMFFFFTYGNLPAPCTGPNPLPRLDLNC